ncbi:hypothetical protein BV22DRAFT_264972 [Leucogyrophana mollusca]|uniref:Uncharacterized protein n=1 Tax=Leucogyrophana mollusca TaxID=85980 RepID=A0ACB8BQL0_9AGAM|nr:hypothetical protein BV22DRAFT_264972 [Leucogyrophana mollusca]
MYEDWRDSTFSVFHCYQINSIAGHSVESIVASLPNALWPGFGAGNVPPASRPRPSSDLSCVTWNPKSGIRIREDTRLIGFFPTPIYDQYIDTRWGFDSCSSQVTSFRVGT